MVAMGETVGRKPKEPESGSGTGGEPLPIPDPPEVGGDVENLLSAWWSRYCPSCTTRHPMSESHCRKDGAPLRDLSVSVSSFLGTTGFGEKTGGGDGGGLYGGMDSWDDDPLERMANEG